MIRRFPWRRLVLGALCLVSLGCEPHHSFLRHNDDDDLDTAKIPAVDSDGKNAKPFFSSDRTSGGWSSEAREIESHFGIN